MSVSNRFILILALVLYCWPASGEEIITVPLTKRTEPLFINDKLTIYRGFYEEMEPRQIIKILSAMRASPLRGRLSR